jgi:hypothetical protein
VLHRALRKVTPGPTAEIFALLWNVDLEQRNRIPVDHSTRRTKPSAYLKQGLSRLIPFLFKHRICEVQRLVLDFLVLLLRLRDMLIDGGQLLF